MSRSVNQPVKLSKSERKVAKKQAKACHTLFKHEGIRPSSTPTHNLVVANGGLGNGIQREEIHDLFSSVGGPVEKVVMLREKPYCFVKFEQVSVAEAAMRTLHGYQLREGQGPTNVTLYLSFVDSVPSDSECQPSHCSLPPGLLLIPDFIDTELEQELAKSIDWGSDTQAQNENKCLKHRRVKHHGYEFNYSTNNVEKDKPMPDGMPALYSQMIDRIMETGHVLFRPDQITINQYQPGQGIPPHVDTHSAFQDAIISLSLGSQVVMEFSHPDGRHIPVVLPSRSLAIMTGESRYMWTHGITPRKSDVIPDPTAEGSLTLQQRGQRTSFTFRAVRHGPCNCKYPVQCDSQKGEMCNSLPPQVAHPKTDEEAARLEEEQVHVVYNNIAEHFSGTRYKAWPKIVEFLNQLQPGSVVLDVGCGNGKYLGVNKQLYMVGCDRSNQLIGICRDRGLEGFVCDSLSLPVRDASMDACICIAVIHHMSTQARRLQALKEIRRALRPGGSALVTVWAMEQERKREKSKYISSRKDQTSSTDRDPSSILHHSASGRDSSDSTHTNFNSHSKVLCSRQCCHSEKELCSANCDSLRTNGRINFPEAPASESSSTDTGYAAVNGNADHQPFSERADGNVCAERGGSSGITLASGVRSGIECQGEDVENITLGTGSIRVGNGNLHCVRLPEGAMDSTTITEGSDINTYSEGQETVVGCVKEYPDVAENVDVSDSSRFAEKRLKGARNITGDHTGAEECEVTDSSPTSEGQLDDKRSKVVQDGVGNDFALQHGNDVSDRHSEDKEKENVCNDAGPCEVIAVHKNRTQFEQQDLLVPWHLKKKSSKDDKSEDEKLDSKDKSGVFFRYYHVFVEGEMEKLCQILGDISVTNTYYDQGNWCVIFKRL